MATNPAILMGEIHTVIEKTDFLDETTQRLILEFFKALLLEQGHCL